MVTEQIHCKDLVINMCLQKMYIIYISNKKQKKYDKIQRYPVLSENIFYVENK